MVKKKKYTFMGTISYFYLIDNLCLEARIFRVNNIFVFNFISSYDRLTA